MMKQKPVNLTFFLIIIFALSLTVHGAELAKPAPDFSLKGADGKTYKLSDYKGKYVVLEWVNYGCPFVGKHYNSGHMQKMQKYYTEKGVIWLTICSSAPGKQGYYEGDALKKMNQEKGLNSTAYLIDDTGKVGRMYEAKTTPHMFVINPDGNLIYAGAIDNTRSTNIKDIDGANNYVSSVLDDCMAGKMVEPKATTPYGCSVKY
jgi:glutathione peroxidase-family protein